MGKQSYLVKQAHALAQKTLANQTQTRVQMCADAAMIAANEVLHMGPGRAPAFAQAFSRALCEIVDIINADTRDMEYSKAKLDERLKTICGEAFQPWEVRYSTDCGAKQ